MKNSFFTAIVFALLGYGIGISSVSKKMPQTLPYDLSEELSSEGRQAILNMRQKLMHDLRVEFGEMFTDKTRALQELTAEKPNRALANFHIGKMEQTSERVQALIDMTLLDTLENLPLSDRRAYLKYYVKNKDYLKFRLVSAPIVAEKQTKTEPQSKDAVIDTESHSLQSQDSKTPRNTVFRKTQDMPDKI